MSKSFGYLRIISPTVTTCMLSRKDTSKPADEEPSIRRKSFKPLDNDLPTDVTRFSQQYEKVGELGVEGAEAPPTSTFKETEGGEKQKSRKQQSTKSPAHAQNAYSEVDVPKGLVFAATDAEPNKSPQEVQESQVKGRNSEGFPLQS